MPPCNLLWSWPGMLTEIRGRGQDWYARPGGPDGTDEPVPNRDRASAARLSRPGRWITRTWKWKDAATYRVCRSIDIKPGSRDQPRSQAPTTPALSQEKVTRSPDQAGPQIRQAARIGTISSHDVPGARSWIRGGQGEQNHLGPHVPPKPVLDASVARLRSEGGVHVGWRRGAWPFH